MPAPRTDDRDGRPVPFELAVSKWGVAAFIIVLRRDRRHIEQVRERSSSTLPHSLW